MNHEIDQAKPALRPLTDSRLRVNVAVAYQNLDGARQALRQFAATSGAILVGTPVQRPDTATEKK